MTGDAVAWSDGDIEGVVLRPVKVHTDQRGWLAELFRSDEVPEGLMPAMGYISVTRPGVARGPHAHREQTDCFAFAYGGRFLLRLWDDRPQSTTYGRRTSLVVEEGNPMVVIVPPGVVHGYKNVSDRDAIVLNFPNRLYAGEGRKHPVDEVRYENEGATAFTMEE